MIRPRLRGPFTDPRFRRMAAGQTLSTFGDTALYGTLAIWAKTLTPPQTVSIAAGAVLISHVGYRALLLAIVVVVGACAAFLLVAPAADPDDDVPAPVPAAAAATGESA